MKRFLAFDIETARILPAEVDDILAYRPLGIACAAAVASDRTEPFVWHGKDGAGRPSPRMQRAEAAALVTDLCGLTASGYTLVTWNGLHFDFNILAEESGTAAACAALATAHVDMLFHVFCSLGHLVSLQKAAEGMRLPGKKAGVSGEQAPALWAAGRFQEVLDYCVQDARLTLRLAEECERARKFAWMTQRGAPKQMPLRGGWLTVDEARMLPLPDTSWMSNPPSRAQFLHWLAKAASV